MFSIRCGSSRDGVIDCITSDRSRRAPNGAGSRKRKLFAIASNSPRAGVKVARDRPYEDLVDLRAASHNVEMGAQGRLGGKVEDVAVALRPIVKGDSALGDDLRSGTLKQPQGYLPVVFVRPQLRWQQHFNREPGNPELRVGGAYQHTPLIERPMPRARRWRKPKRSFSTGDNAPRGLGAAVGAAVGSGVAVARGAAVGGGRRAGLGRWG